MTDHVPVARKRAMLQILPATVSQLLSAPQVSNDTFVLCDWELNQLSVVGIVRGFSLFVKYVQYSVDDMTGPPLNVKQWVDTEDSPPMAFPSPGSYVKVIGSLHNFSGQRSLLAMNIRCVKDLNEITSHMLEVVQAHMQLSGEVLDVNMNTTFASLSGGGAASPEGILSNGLSTSQDQVLQVVRRFSVRDVGISLTDLKTELDYLSMKDIRSSLAVLVNEGHVFSTINELHFKSTDY